mmetsp:Transcript_12140/g.39616  ORF Transcript_12140/g.39616 Transcript_12140/m.39616 type:complete len:230 (-) Transcript_12140:14-703(-)
MLHAETDATYAHTMGQRRADPGGALRGPRCSIDVRDGHLDLDPRLDRDGGDLLDDLRRRVQVDEALVDAHLEPVPGVGTLTARRLAGGDAERLGRQPDRALDLEPLVLGTLDEVSADLLEVLDVAAGQGDPDAVDLDSCVVLELLRLHGGCVLREEDAALSDGGGGAKGEPAPEGRGVESEGDGAESCPPPGKGAGPLLGGGAPPSMPWWARVLRTATLTEATRSTLGP